MVYSGEGGGVGLLFFLVRGLLFLGGDTAFTNGWWLVVTGRMLSSLSERVLGLVSRSTQVPFLRMTHTYGMDNTTVRRHMTGLAGLNVVGNSRFIVSPRGVNCRAYTCVKLFLGRPRGFSRIMRRLGGVPRMMRYRCAANNFSVFVGVCTIGGRRLLRVVRSGLRPLNLSEDRAVVSFGTTVSHRLSLGSVRRISSRRRRAARRWRFVF